MPYSKDLRIGMLINNGGQFVNGSEQQPWFIMEIIQGLGNKLTIFTHKGKDESSGLSRSETFYGHEMTLLTPEKLADVDVLLMICHIVDDGTENTLALKNACKGKRVVQFHCGNHMYFNAEDVIFDRHDVVKLLYNTWFTESWVFDMHFFASSYYQLLTHKPTKRMPYAWTPTLLNKFTSENTLNIRCDASRYNKALTLCCVEPNLNVTKTCLVPLLIMNEFYRRYPTKINTCFVFCSTQLLKHRSFLEFLKFLDIVRDKMVEFYPRMSLPSTIDQMKKKNLSPVFVGHNIENEQNYVTLEMLYLGYPMLHNSKYIQRAGFYYEDTDLMTAVEHLNNMDKFESQFRSYVASSKSVLDDHSTSNPTILAEFAALLDDDFKNTEEIDWFQHQKMLKEKASEKSESSNASGSELVASTILSPTPPPPDPTPPPSSPEDDTPPVDNATTKNKAKNIADNIKKVDFILPLHDVSDIRIQ